MHEIWSGPGSEVSISHCYPDYGREYYTSRSNVPNVPISFPYSGLVFVILINRGVRYHEPEYWKFGENGNKYFRHATGQLYAISRDLASYISINQ